MEFYYKINQLDGRVENYHLNVEDENIYLDHNDSNEPGDADGEYVGYLEHYGLKK